MLFASMSFLWIFLPTVLIVNMLLSKVADGRLRYTLKNVWLLIASLIFYAWGGIYYLLIMFFSIVLNYTAGRLMERRRARSILLLAIVLNLAMLFVFKYFNMLVVVLENMIGMFSGAMGCGQAFGAMFSMQGTGALGIKEIVLPIGISFFTFQAMSYVIDVYSGRVQVQKNILKFALYVSFFPQLIA